jgi:hypothetical protein
MQQAQSGNNLQLRRRSFSQEQSIFEILKVVFSIDLTVIGLSLVNICKKKVFLPLFRQNILTCQKQEMYTMWMR